MFTDVSNAPARGAYCDLHQLMNYRYPAQKLHLSQRNRALNALSGPNKTNFRGRGIEFEEVRSYQPGDDIRTIDWRVTARTGNAHTKMFREERERPVLVVTDQRNCMFFGSDNCCKSVLASDLAALLCWAALQQGDRVGGLVFNGHRHAEVRPRRSRRSVLAYLHELAGFNQSLPISDAEARHSFADMLNELLRISKPGSAIFIISDFRGATSTTAMEHLYQLSRRGEITAIHCSDRLERELPRSGNYSVTNGVQKSRLYTGDRIVRKNFAQHFLQELDQLREGCGKLGIPVIQASTAESPLSCLLTYYSTARGARRSQ